MKTKLDSFDTQVKERLCTIKSHQTKKGMASLKEAFKSYYQYRYIEERPLYCNRDYLFFDSIYCCPLISREAHELSRSITSGWYTDNFQVGMIVPMVFSMRLKARGLRGKLTVHMEGYKHTDSGLVVVDTRRFYESELEAAHAANNTAEILSEMGREEDAKYQAELQIEELKCDLHKENEHVIKLVKGIKESTGGYKALKSEVIKRHSLFRENIFDEIARLRGDYWLSVM